MNTSIKIVKTVKTNKKPTNDQHLKRANTHKLMQQSRRKARNNKKFVIALNQV